jgi:hypothetical protein
MATILDTERQEDELLDGEELHSFDEPVEEEVVEEEPVQETPQEDDLPEKYRGKTPAEIARMHQEAEKMLGRQSGEVGELRKIVDDFVKSQLETKTTQSAVEEEEVDWYTDPDKAVQRAIDNHPKLKEAEKVTSEMAKAKTLAELQRKHPDFNDILGDPAFGEWVSGSKIRLQLFQQADQNYDVDAADELLSTWKERQSFAQQAVKQDKETRKDKVKSASTGGQAASGEAPSRKIYRRADIIKLMQTDPDRYMAMADEIQKAYAEKRVR